MSFNGSVTTEDASGEVWPWGGSGGTPPNDSCGRLQTTKFVSPSEAAVWLTRISFPLLLLVGTLGNSLGIWLVLKERRHGRRRGSRPLDRSRARKIFLLALFASDLCYLWNRLIFLLITDAWTPMPTDSQTSIGETFLALYTHGLFAFVDAVLSFSSQGILVAFCVDRYYALTSPLRHKTQQSMGRTASLVVVGFIYTANAACSMIIPVFYYWSLVHSLQFQAADPPETAPLTLPDTLVRWRIVDAWGEVLIRFASALVIIILNRLIFLKLKACTARLAAHTSRPPDASARLLPASHGQLSNSPSLISTYGYGFGPRVVPTFHLQLTVTDPAERDVHYTLSTTAYVAPASPPDGSRSGGISLPRSSSYFAAANGSPLNAATVSRSRSSFRTSRSANMILLCSSVFYLVTNSLDLVVSLVSMLGMYPLCLLDHATEITYACEPFRDLLRHSYFAFSFLFYVCLKLRKRPELARRRSSSYCTGPTAPGASNGTTGERSSVRSKRSSKGPSRQNSAPTTRFEKDEELTVMTP